MYKIRDTTQRKRLSDLAGNSTVNGQYVAIDVLSSGRHQKHCGPADFIRLSPALQRVPTYNKGREFRIIHQSCIHFCCKKSWCNYVAANSLWAEFYGKVFRQTNNFSLGGCIGGNCFTSLGTHDRGKLMDASRLLLQHQLRSLT